MRTPRTALFVAVLAVLAVLVPATPPAFAAISRVGVVAFAGASTTSLTLSWPAASGARGYQVWKSLHKDMAYRTVATSVSGNAATVTGLTPGETYCFQVQGKSGSSVGLRSAVTCHPTIRTQSAATGPAYKVMSFNACTEACSGWTTRSAAARNMVKARQPDMIALQESGAWRTPPPGYAVAFSKSAKQIFYKTSRFTVASNGARAGYILMRGGSPGRYAVWAELVDRDSGKHLIFVSAHTSPAFADYPARTQEIQTLVSKVNQLNTSGLAVIYAGDFNSNKNRGTYSEAAGFGSQDTVGRAFAAAGYYDSYDLARTLKRNNWSSYGGWSTTPKKSISWGDHVDHVYLKPSRTNVYQWMNAALYSGSRYTSPLPSDHRPVMAQLYLN